MSEPVATLCLECDRFYFGSYGAHWRFAHNYGQEIEKESDTWNG